MLQLEWSPAESDEYCLGQLTAIGNDVSLELVKNSSICALNVKESGITISHEKDKIYKGKVEVSFEEAGPRLRGFDRNGDLVFSIP